MSTGTDEHGIKIQQAAATNKMTPQEHVDFVSRKFQHLADLMNVRYDRFIRTTDEDHRMAVTEMWKRLKDRGFIYKGSHEGWYSVSDECFYPDSQVMEVPSIINVGKVEHVSKETGKLVERVTEENYMFSLSKFRDPLLDWLRKNPAVVYPSNQYNQVLAWIGEGLPDISISRPRNRQTWGIKVPDDENHTIYVWIDALTNYLTITGFPTQWDFHSSQPDFRPQTHIIGKDILRFHAIYWPALLMAAGLPPPQRIISHAHWTSANSKMSKSLGNVVDPVELVDKYGVDAVRYYILRDGGISEDGDFSEDMLKMRYHVELADQLGNLLARCLGKVVNPDSIVPHIQNQQFYDEQGKFIQSVNSLSEHVQPLFDLGEFGKGLGILMKQVHETNKYIQSHEPWKLAKSKDPRLLEKANVIVNNCLEAIRVYSILLQPAIPGTSEQILNALSVEPQQRTLQHARIQPQRAGTRISKIIPFPKHKH